MTDDRYAMRSPRYLLVTLSDSSWPVERVMEVMRGYGEVVEVQPDEPRYTVTPAGRAALEGGE